MKSIFSEYICPQGEFNTLPSDTVPGQVLSTKDLVIRAAYNIPTVGRDVEFDADGDTKLDIDDIDPLNRPIDNLDIQDIHREVQQEVNSKYKQYLSQKEPDVITDETAPAPK